MTALARTTAEIIDLYNLTGAENDFFSAYRSSLLEGLAFEDARPLLKDGVTAEQWEPDGSRSFVINIAREYMEFARDKADDHRGLSAGRSIDHFRAWMWLLGVDDRVDWDDYRPYGAPILKRVSELLEMGWPYADDSGMGRMGNGRSCAPHCSGC